MYHLQMSSDPPWLACY